MFIAYFKWHYGRALAAVFGIAQNFLAFSAHLFSTKELFSSLFAPFKQISFQREGSIFRSGAMTIVWTNIISRFFGAVARSFIILAGLFFILLVGFADLVLLFFWLTAPVLPIVFFILGFKILSS